MNPDENTVILTVPGKTSRTFRTGDVVGDNYCLLGLIGQGGMGVVYRCRHQIIGHEYALKVLRPDQVNEQSWRRFELEGRAIARLDHPNIVKIFNMGVDGGDCPYYVMELLTGQSLEAYTGADKPLSLDQKLDIFGQLAAALNYAHGKDIIHRDIKPGNVILEKNLSGKYNAKIVDFGIAKLVGNHTFTKQSLTAAGEVFGSPLYMSPEQAQGSEVDARSDIYSLGCTFFKTLTGRPPFEGDAAFQTILMHQNQVVPALASVVEDVVFPEALEHLVQKMLAKRPAERYQSMAQVSHDIERLQDGKTLEKKALTEYIASEDDGSVGQHRETSIKAYVLSVVIAVVFICGVGGFVLISPQNKKQSSVGIAATAPTKPSTVGIAHEPESPAAKDIAMEKATASFRSFKPHPTIVFQKNDKRWLRFYFPDTGVGVLDGSGMLVPAAGVQEMDATHYLTLDIHSVRDRYTWANPWIVEKIDSVNITDLALNEDGDWEPPPTPGLSKVSKDRPALEMLAIASHWKHFEGLELFDFPVSPELLDAVKDTPGLKRLTISNSQLTGPALVSFPCLQQLQVLGVMSMKEVDPVLMAIAGSKSLQLVNVSNTKASPAAIRALKTCPDLQSILFQHAELSDAHYEAISELSHLRHVWLEHVELDPKQLMRLKALKNLENIFITPQHWSSAETEMVRKELPKCIIPTENNITTDLNDR